MYLMNHERKTILITMPNEAESEELKNAIEKEIPLAHFYFAHDSRSAISKMINDPPNILIVSEFLPKQSGITTVEWMLKESRLSNTAAIILSDIPHTDTFPDEVVIGQVQFMKDWDKNKQFGKTLGRALNFVTRGEPKEFNLRYLTCGKRLISEGAHAEFVYFVKEGKLKAIAHKNDEEVFLGEIKPGEFAGEMAYIDGKPRNADVIALSDCVLIEIPIDQLDHVLFERPAWGKALMKTLSKRILDLNKKIQS